MTTLTIKNIPDELYHALKQQATLNHRSLNSEVIVSLAQVVQKSSLSVQSVLRDVRALRIKTNQKVILTNALINREKRKGRT